MFSGIVTNVGRIAEIIDREGGLRLSVSAGSMDMSDVQVGDSIAVNGACLTVVKLNGNAFGVELSRETLDRTVGLDVLGEQVNLEKALRFSERLGGHLVCGHIDGVGEVVEFTNLGDSWKLVVNAPPALARYLATKGSITINGVSLTINQVSSSEELSAGHPNQLSVNLIPHTVAMTNLRNLSVGSRVNLEVDLIARYVERMMLKEDQ